MPNTSFLYYPPLSKQISTRIKENKATDGDRLTGMEIERSGTREHQASSSLTEHFPTGTSHQIHVLHPPNKTQYERTFKREMMTLNINNTKLEHTLQIRGSDDRRVASVCSDTIVHPLNRQTMARRARAQNNMADTDKRDYSFPTTQKRQILTERRLWKRPRTDVQLVIAPVNNTVLFGQRKPHRSLPEKFGVNDTPRRPYTDIPQSHIAPPHVTRSRPFVPNVVPDFKFRPPIQFFCRNGDAIATPSSDANKLPCLQTSKINLIVQREIHTSASSGAYRRTYPSAIKLPSLTGQNSQRSNFSASTKASIKLVIPECGTQSEDRSSSHSPSVNSGNKAVDAKSIETEQQGVRKSSVHTNTDNMET